MTDPVWNVRANRVSSAWRAVGGRLAVETAAGTELFVVPRLDRTIAELRELAPASS